MLAEASAETLIRTGTGDLSTRNPSTSPVVVYGGTFDPVHHGHLIVARAVAEAKGYGKVILLPSADPPHKASARAGAADRLAMLRLAVEGDGLFETSGIELRREGKSYTIDTLRDLREQHGGDIDIHWIIGADMLADLANWRRASEVVDQARIVVAMRPPWHERVDAALADLAGRLGRERADRIAGEIVGTPLIDISSTNIRRRVAQGRPIRYLVSEEVEEYILNKNLYS